MMKRKISTVFLLCLLVAFVSCGGDSATTSNSDRIGNGDDGGGNDNGSSTCASSIISGLSTSGSSSDSFSSTGVFSSITQSESCSSTLVGNALALKKATIDADDVKIITNSPEAVTAYVEAIATADNESVFPDCAAYIIEPDQGEAPTCYGPQIKYQYHLDAQSRSDGGGSQNCDELICAFPTGDLGIWTATEGDTDEACAAATMNYNIKYVSGFSNMAKNVQAIVECLANRATDPISRPDAGSVTITDAVNAAILNDGLEFSSVTWTENSGVYTITLVAGANGTVNILTDNHTAGTEIINIWGFFGGEEGLKKGMPFVDIASYHAFSLYGKKVGSNENLKFISAIFENTLPDLNNHFDNVFHMLNLDSPWSMDHRTILLNDDSSTDKLMKYSWIAGQHESPPFNKSLTPDTYSRTFLAKVNQAETSGVAYYGYGYGGASNETPEDRMTITNFICNWTGPNQDQSPTTGQNLAQKQTMTKADANSPWVTTDELSEINYAPVRSCKNDNDNNGSIDTRALNEDSNGEANGSEPAATAPMDWGYTDSLGEAFVIAEHELVDLGSETADDGFATMVDPTAPSL